MSVSNGLLNRDRAAGFHSTTFTVWERSGMEMSIWLTSSWSRVMTALWPLQPHGELVFEIWTFVKIAQEGPFCFLKSTAAVQNVPRTANVWYYPRPNCPPCFARIILWGGCFAGYSAIRTTHGGCQKFLGASPSIQQLSNSCCLKNVLDPRGTCNTFPALFIMYGEPS